MLIVLGAPLVVRRDCHVDTLEVVRMHQRLPAVEAAFDFIFFVTQHGHVGP